jgi:hypothetical protein
MNTVGLDYHKLVFTFHSIGDDASAHFFIIEQCPETMLAKVDANPKKRKVRSLNSAADLQALRVLFGRQVPLPILSHCTHVMTFCSELLCVCRFMIVQLIQEPGN